MALLKIARLGHPCLRQHADPVTAGELSSPEFQQFIDDMIQTMHDGDGVGLAATQVHVRKRVFLVEVKAPHPRYPDQSGVPLTVIVNPKIRKHAKKVVEDWEGCLSIPDLRGRVPRWRSLELSGLDRNGKPISLKAQDFFARVIQHELDHLDGIVFLDRMRDFSTLSHLREYQAFWAGAGKPAPVNRKAVTASAAPCRRRTASRR
jgi:peptide deformylase